MGDVDQNNDNLALALDATEDFVFDMLNKDAAEYDNTNKITGKETKKQRLWGFFLLLRAYGSATSSKMYHYL